MMQSRLFNDGQTREFRVGDCRIWAVIFYLDSPTDYREYLPAGDRAQGPLPAETKLVMLDESKGFDFLGAILQWFCQTFALRLIHRFHPGQTECTR